MGHGVRIAGEVPGLPEPSEEDAFDLIVAYLLKGMQARSDYSTYGYDLYLPNVIREFIRTKFPTENANQRVNGVSPAFMNAAWTLARLGVIRPGVREFKGQTTDEGAGGCGFSVTFYGRKWLQDGAEKDNVATHPGRVSEMLDKFTPKYGQAYKQRSQEAVGCYVAQKFLACCAMCGSAAESILVAIGIEKEKDETKVLADYLASGGRLKLENMVFGQQTKVVREKYKNFVGLLNTWRDSAAHGHAIGISEREAHTALVLLLQLAGFVESHWADLTK